MTLASLWQDRNPRTGRRADGCPRPVRRRRDRRGADRSHHRTAPRPRRAVGGGPGGRPGRRRHHRAEHRQAQPLQGTRLSTIRSRHPQSVVTLRRGAARGRGLGAPVLRRSTASPCSIATPSRTPTARDGERSLRSELDAAAGPVCRSSGSTTCRCRSPSAAPCACRTSSSSTRSSCSTRCRTGRGPRRAHRRRRPGRCGYGGATRSASTTEARPGRGAPGRRGDQPAGAGPGRLLRPDEACSLVRRGLPDRTAGGRRDVPVRGRAVPVAARRAGRRRPPAAGGRQRAHHRSWRSTHERLDGAADWTHQHWPDAVETHAWSAQDYVPHHALPYAGPILPGNDEIVVAGGYSKWGMTNAPAAALALAARLLGGTTRLGRRASAPTRRPSCADCRPRPGTTPRSAWR